MTRRPPRHLERERRRRRRAAHPRIPPWGRAAGALPRVVLRLTPRATSAQYAALAAAQLACEGQLEVVAEYADRVPDGAPFSLVLYIPFDEPETAVGRDMAALRAFQAAIGEALAEPPEGGEPS